MSTDSPPVFISRERIDARVLEMGRALRDDCGEGPIVCVGVLKGSFIFMADLVRAIGGHVECDFLGVSSYQGTESTGVVRITHDLRSNIEGKHCVIVEDIIDSGRTLEYLRVTLQAKRPASLRIVTLLDKPSRRTTEVPVDIVGFSIPNEFVIGYGLDLNERYRNLPYIGIYEGEVDH